MKAEKIEAMKKNNKRAQFLYNLILYSLTSLITCLFFSYPFNWFPSSMKHLILFYLETTDFSDFVNPKSLFVVANLIIFILIGESKLSSSRYSSPASDVYDEYIRRNRSRLKLNSSDDEAVIIKEDPEEEVHASMQSVKLCEEKKHGNIIKKREIRVSRSRQYYQKEKKSNSGGMRVSKSEVWGESEIAKMEKKMEERESIIPKEELDKRVEDFISRVNKQRLLEAKLEQLIM
ncbi:hypothetical protein MIMGU_mgv1a018495mg [Erythranthe guttata]|uniref:DUF4408 domain-containing protein n=1 Tax=Erythranthe guttata TaxID=4155 RepID=A0A022QIS9_ERYGU|nr:hypothetical protein MIMGU_mgv1a018495mg [Erythranthe guttata]